MAPIRETGFGEERERGEELIGTFCPSPGKFSNRSPTPLSTLPSYLSSLNCKFRSFQRERSLGGEDRKKGEGGEEEKRAPFFTLRVLNLDFVD